MRTKPDAAVSGNHIIHEGYSAVNDTTVTTPLRSPASDSANADIAVVTRFQTAAKHNLY